jgi:hypothetical protein
MNAQALLEAINYQGLVSGYTHNYYRYPARFSPRFARGIIEAFSEPGQVVLDPFMGGATTLVEARALGRHSVGCDVSSLSVFLGRVKTTPLSKRDVGKVADWILGLPEYLNLHCPPVRVTNWKKAGYQRHLPWPIRKSIELALARLRTLPRRRQQRLARCVLLKAGQWALDCRERIPTAAEFRRQLLACVDSFVEGMREFRDAVKAHRVGGRAAKTLSIQCLAADVPNHTDALESFPNRPTLVVTSPPYPGVYVLYHRWKVRGRKESPAPFWLADCKDGQGQAHYCFGHRKQRRLTSYFKGISASFAGVRQVIDASALVAQMVAFSEPDWQIPSYLEAMDEAGFDEVPPEALGLPVAKRLWRSVPSRRWFALIQGSLATSKEVVIFHRPKPA